MTCKCDQIFSNFKWENLASLEIKDLPKNSGVYAIRVKKKVSSVDSSINKTKDFFNQSNWNSANEFIFSRLERLKSIDTGQCQVIYVGKAPSKEGIQGRYKDLSARRHTIFYSLLALLISGWELEYGWKKSKKSAIEEKSLVEEYRKYHRGKNPALLRRV